MSERENDVKKAIKILGLTPPFSLLDIKKAYKQRAKDQHPDLHAGNVAAAENDMKEINWAYRVLMGCFENIKIPMALLVSSTQTEEEWIRRRFYYDWMPSNGDESP